MTPIYIVSKGRHDCQTTSTHLTEMGRPHFVVVEPSEVDAYRAALDGTQATVLQLPVSEYHAAYDVCDDRGLTASPGPGPARNFVWDHAQDAGAAWHWVMDDNIDGFFRCNRNLKIYCKSPRIFDAMQDFCERFERVSMAGPQYCMFLERRAPWAPFAHNTRIYSCNMIRTAAPYRWRGRYNEDTDLSLRMLKDGWNTIQFNAFLQAKRVTQNMKGGNTAAFYAKEGTLPKSQMLADLHPDCASVEWRFSRWHHHVDYTRFKSRRLKLRADVTLPDAPNEYGMRLQVRDGAGGWEDARAPAAEPPRYSVGEVA